MTPRSRVTQIAVPLGPCAQSRNFFWHQSISIVITFKAQVYPSWVHGPIGSVCVSGYAVVWGLGVSGVSVFRFWGLRGSGFRVLLGYGYCEMCTGLGNNSLGRGTSNNSTCRSPQKRLRSQSLRDLA